MELGVSDGVRVAVVVGVLLTVGVAVDVGVSVFVGVNVGDGVMLGVFDGVAVIRPGVLVVIWSVLVMVRVGVSVTKAESGASVMAINPMQ